MEELIYQRLMDAFQPTHLVIENQSPQHASHSSSPQTGSSHFRVELAAPCLDGLSKIDQQRRVYAALKDAFDQGLHALSLDIKRSSE